MAIDREFLADKVWGGAMFPAYGFVPPGIEGYKPYRPEYADAPEIDREDEAARILQALGYGPDNPLKLELRYDTSENNQNTGIAIQEQLRPLGIEVTLHNSDAKTHFGHLDGGGDFDFARSGWIGDYKDPETFLGIARKASGNNLGHYDSPEFERVMEAAAAAGANPQQRMQLLSQAEKVLVDADGMLPLLFYSSHNIVSSQAQGLGGERDGYPSVSLHHRGAARRNVHLWRKAAELGGVLVAKLITCLCSRWQPEAHQTRSPSERGTTMALTAVSQASAAMRRSPNLLVLGK